MANIPKPEFPNVPNVPGVPQVLRSPFSPATQLSLLATSLGAIALWKSTFSKPQWAIYKTQQQTVKSDDGLEEVIIPGGKRVAVVVPDSFGGFTYRNEWSLCDHPVEQGAFSSYNKIANPFETSVRMNKGGTKEARQKFLDSIEAIQGTLDLYDIITPERSYLNVNVLRYELAREGARNAYFLTDVELYFREIRQTVSTYSSTSTATQDSRNISAKPVSNIGTVFAQPISLKPSVLNLQ